MATFAVPVEPQLAAKQKRAAHRSDRRFALLLVTALTPFALAVHGYHPYAEDGGLYLAGVKHLLSPALYPHATAFVLEPTRLSLFAPLIASATRLSHLPLPIVLLALHLATLWTTLFAAWMLASRCWSNRAAHAGAVVLLACWLSLPIAGTALLLMDPYLTARSLSTSCMVLALVGALDATGLRATRIRGLCLCLAALALATMMHPLMATYAIAATLLLICLRSISPTLRLWATPTLFALALTLAACLHLAAKSETPDTIRIALTRTYWFPSQWAWYELLGLAAPILILATFARRSSSPPQPIAPPTPQRALAQMALTLGATATLIAAIFCRATAATHLVARLQPLRAFQIVYLIMVLMLGATLGERILRRHAWRWAATLLLLGGIMFAAARTAFPASSHVELPFATSPNNWTQAFLWVRTHTPNVALFALDADYINAPGEDAQCFRAIAERSALPDYSKDGGEASIAPELTAAWKQGQTVQQNLSQSTDASRISALAPLGVSWLVLKANAQTTFDCPYTNAQVKVCRLP